MKPNKKIENVYSYITEKEPKALFVFYSGHEVCERRGQRYFDVSDEQGDALNISRLRDFIKSLLPCEQFVVLDCCSAGEINLLPEEPGVDNPNHIQFSSSKYYGESYSDIHEKPQGTFSFCVISALRAAAACHEKNVQNETKNKKKCPNSETNYCPCCLEFREVISKNECVTYADLWDYLRYHYKEMRIGDHEIPFLNRPEVSTLFPPFFNIFNFFYIFKEKYIRLPC